ncbi:MAG: thioredoxin [Chloroflexota bacterium]|nr:thioredoxin [Chloroflexota bacterium]
MGNIVSIDNSNFDEAVIGSKTPVLIDFWAPWCGPCKAIAPILEELSVEYEGKLTIAKLNIDEAPQNASKYGVSAIPTMLLFKDGQPVQSIVGYKPKAELKKAIDENL